MERYNFTNPLFLFKIEAMIRRFSILFCLIFLVACNDGDIITIDLDFEGNLDRCEDFEDSYLLYDTREDPNEALILIIQKDDANELLFTNPTTEGTPVQLTINETTNRFIFRSYNRAIEGDELCEVVPPGNLNITDNNEANNGTVFITTTILDNDGDGLSNEQEGLAGIPNEEGIYEDSLDTDTDGIPDYLDQDDDNDNILTLNEIDTDEDGNLISIDTDSDGTQNYLDNDDDGDGVLTRLEDSTATQNPRAFGNLVVDEAGDDVYRYLYNHPTAMEPFEDTGFIFNSYTRSVSTSFVIEGAGLEIINSDFINFGTYNNSFSVSNNPDAN